MRKFVLSLLAVFVLVSSASADTMTKRGFRQDLNYEILNDLMTEVNTYRSSSINRCTGVMGATPVAATSGQINVTVGTCSVILSGDPYVIEGSTTVVLTGGNQSTGTWRHYVIQVNPALVLNDYGGSSSSESNEYSPYTVVAGTASSTRASATWPTLTSGNVAVGYVTVKANGTFTPGTTAFDIQTSTVFGTIVGPYYATGDDVDFSPADDSGAE